jgi:uncharacterized protein YkwD
LKARTLIRGAVLAAACALPAPASAGTPELLGSLLTEVNAARVDAGLWPLRADMHLSIAASAYAARMGTEGFFSHDAPDGTDVVDRARAVRWPGLRRNGWELHELLGQASGVLDSPKVMVAAWLQSPPHRAGMLDPDVSHAGLGVVDGRWVLITADPGEPRKRKRARAARRRG